MIFFEFFHFCQCYLQTLVGFSHWCFSFCSKFWSFSFLLVGDFLLYRYNFLHLFGFCLINSKFCHELISLDWGFFKLRLHFSQFNLHLFDCIVGLEELIETVLESWDWETGLFTLVSEDSLVSVQKFKINCRRDVVDSAQLCLERDWLLLNTFMDRLEDLYEDIQLSFKSQLNLNLGQLPLTDADQGFFRPFREPVDGTSIDQWREHS